MDQNLLLTAEKLTLNPDIQRGWTARETLVIKNVPAQTYLTVSREQAVVLEAFTQAETVPKVLARLLQQRGCPPLREFYELIVKAHRGGILCSGTTRKPVREPVRWPALKAGFIKWPAAATAAAVLGWLAWGYSFGDYALVWAEVLVGAIVALAALSAGQMLAAALLAGAGGEVYPRAFLASLVRLHVRFDLGDRKLLRPAEQVLIKLAGNWPLSAVLLAMLVKFPGAAPVAIVLWLLAWRPWGAGLPRRLAGVLNRYPHLDTDSSFEFLPNQRPQRHWRPAWRRWDWRVCALELVWAAAWTLLVARLALDALDLSLAAVAGDREYWSWSLPLVGSAVLLSAAVVMMRRWRDGLRQAVRKLRQRCARLWRHWRHEYVFPDNEAALLRLTASHPLLGQLNPYDQAAVGRAWRPARFGAWEHLAAPEEEGAHVGLILSGRATATRAAPDGRRVRALSLAEGDFFGLPQLKADDARLDVKSRTPIAAMMLPMGVFKAVVMARLEAGEIYDLTHKLAFLKRLPVCAYWHPHAVARFARISQVASYADGDHVLHENDDARWFYIVYDGIAQVRSRGKLLSRLKAGDFFGEISLLQNSVTVADVVAQGRMRCLQIDRTSFLRFVTHNHHVALQLEKISSARLGRPVFPLRPGMPAGIAR